LSSFKRLRDEKKRKKTTGPEDLAQHFILLCITTKCIRAIRVTLRNKNKAEMKEMTIPIDTRSKVSCSILQIAKSSEEHFTLFASSSSGRIEIFQMKLYLTSV
jgi:hypothetical protein